MLTQLTRPACARHSRIPLLRWNGRECGRIIHQASSGIEASKDHIGRRTSPRLKGLSGFNSFGFHSFHSSFCTGWPTHTRLRWHCFPHDQYSHEVFKEATVGVYILISLAFISFGICIILQNVGRRGSVELLFRQ